MSTSSNKRYASPLRYPGGKGKIANYFKVLFLKNDLVGHQYVEPYAGGAGVALELLFEEFTPSIHINDIDGSVYAFWDAVLHDTEVLCQRISRARVSLAEWHRNRRVQVAAEDGVEVDPMDLAFSTFFLNRTNRSGIINGGMIGGKAQRGKWTIGARYNKSALIKRIEKIGRFSSRITLTNRDTADLLRDIVGRRAQGGRMFVYLDPPYYSNGERLYRNAYTHEDHQEIAELVAQLECPWVVSYDACKEVRTMYRSWRRIEYGLGYSANDHYEGGEVMFFSSDLKPPRETKSPAGVSARVVVEAIAGRLIA